MASYLPIILVLLQLGVDISNSDDVTTRPGYHGYNISDMCDARAPDIPDDSIVRCSSCKNRCGTKTVASALYDPEWTGYGCACDKFCLTNKDCCKDYETFCADEYKQGNNILAQLPVQNELNDFYCWTFPIYGGKINRVWNLVLRTCADGSPCQYKVTGMDINLSIPMYDVDRGYTYISAACAVCNNAQNVIPFQAKLTCFQFTKGSTKSESVQTIDTIESLEDAVDSYASCHFEFNITYSRPCYAVEAECSDNCQNANLRSECLGYQGYTGLGKKVYRNAHCLLCSGERGNSEDMNCQSEDFIPQRRSVCEIWHPSQVPRVQRSLDRCAGFSMSLLFDFNPGKGLSIGSKPSADCPQGEVYIIGEESCRQMKCPSGYVLNGTQCIPDVTEITIHITAKVTNASSDIDTLLNQSKEFSELSLKAVEEMFKTLKISFTNFSLETNVTANNGSSVIDVVYKMNCNCDFTGYISNNGASILLHDKLIKIGESGFATWSEGSNIQLVSFTSTLSHNIDWDVILSPSMKDCVWLAYKLEEVVLSNDTVIIRETKKTYSSSLAKQTDDVLTVCDKTVKGILVDIDGDTSAVDIALGVITLLCALVSIICLVIRIVLQFFISQFKNRPGQLQLHLTGALLFMFTWLVIGPFLSDQKEACELGAILLAYGFLASFTWMSVIAMDTWLVFRPSSAFSRANDGPKGIRNHIILGWGIPVVLMILPIALNHANINDDFVPGFGGDRCWYQKRYAMLIFFGIPILISICMNTVLYIFTAINLREAFKNSMKAKKDEHHFGIYIRLFVLMGTTWIFGFIAAFANTAVLDFIFVILAGLQGVFLFVSVVCTRRIFDEMRKKSKTFSSLTSGISRQTSETSGISRQTSETSTVVTRSTPLPSVSSVSEDPNPCLKIPGDSTI